MHKLKKIWSIAKTHKVMALILVLSIIALSVSGGIVAFLSVSEKANNTFTMGKMSINLFEDDWYDHNTYAASKTISWLDDDGDDAGAPGTAGNNIPDFAENLLCGQQISKTPYVETQY